VSGWTSRSGCFVLASSVSRGFPVNGLEGGDEGRGSLPILFLLLLCLFVSLLTLLCQFIPNVIRFLLLACIGSASADDVARFRAFHVVDAADHGGDPFRLRPLHVLEAAERVCRILVRLMVDRWWVGGGWVTSGWWCERWLWERHNPKPRIDGGYVE